MVLDTFKYPGAHRRRSGGNKQQSSTQHLEAAFCAVVVAGTLCLLSLATAWLVFLNNNQQQHLTIQDTISPPKILIPENQQRLEALHSVVDTAATTTPLPLWVHQYMEWHREQVRTLTAGNWRGRRFLISRCLRSDRTCGGVSDRLKSLPTLLLLAHQSQRILLYSWSRPAQLEQFLLPVEINWTVPHYVPVHGSGTRLYTKLATLIRSGVNGSVPVVCTRLQDQHGGSEYYNSHPLNQHVDRAFRKVFRTLFFTVFAPSPSVQSALDQIRFVLPAAADVTNGDDAVYAAAHLRAYYGNSPIPPSKVGPTARNAINCASEISPPGTPILFVSDSNRAVQSIRSYDRPRLLTLPREGAEPLHLDKAAESANIHEYMSIFVDLLLLSKARCISHGQGGFGRFGVLLSKDPMCFKKYIDNARFIECDWRDETS
jgi:hypothetical protein